MRETYEQMATALGWDVQQEPGLPDRASYQHSEGRALLVIDWGYDGISSGWAEFTGPTEAASFTSAGDELWRAVLWLNWVNLKSAFGALKLEQQRRDDDLFAQMVSDTWNANREL